MGIKWSKKPSQSTNEATSSPSTSVSGMKNNFFSTDELAFLDYTFHHLAELCLQQTLATKEQQLDTEVIGVSDVGGIISKPSPDELTISLPVFQKHFHLLPEQLSKKLYLFFSTREQKTSTQQQQQQQLDLELGPIHSPEEHTTKEDEVELTYSRFVAGMQLFCKPKTQKDIVKNYVSLFAEHREHNFLTKSAMFEMISLSCSFFFCLLHLDTQSFNSSLDSSDSSSQSEKSTSLESASFLSQSEIEWCNKCVNHIISFLLKNGSVQSVGGTVQADMNEVGEWTAKHFPSLGNNFSLYLYFSACSFLLTSYNKEEQLQLQRETMGTIFPVLLDSSSILTRMDVWALEMSRLPNTTPNDHAKSLLTSVSARNISHSSPPTPTQSRASTSRGKPRRVGRSTSMSGLPIANRDESEVSSMWKLLYSSQRDGSSITQLCHRVSGYKSDTFVVIEDTKGRVFGGFADTEWVLRTEFAGGDGCFLFSLHPNFFTCRTRNVNKNCIYLYTSKLHNSPLVWKQKKYPYSKQLPMTQNQKQSSSSYQVLPEGFGLGGQLNYFRLFVNDELTKGVCRSVCSTYENGMVCGGDGYSAAPGEEEHFDVRVLELWGVGSELSILQQESLKQREEQVLMNRRRINKQLLWEYGFPE